jgi:hypothetical protein
MVDHRTARRKPRRRQKRLAVRQPQLRAQGEHQSTSAPRMCGRWKTRTATGPGPGGGGGGGVTVQVCAVNTIRPNGTSAFRIRVISFPFLVIATTDGVVRDLAKTLMLRGRAVEPRAARNLMRRDDRMAARRGHAVRFPFAGAFGDLLRHRPTAPT